VQPDSTTQTNFFVEKFDPGSNGQATFRASFEATFGLEAE
jgi:hypothetical protein